MRSFIVAAAVLWGTAGAAGTFASAGPVSMAAARLVLGGAALAVLALPHGPVLRPLRRSLALGAACVAAYQLCFFAAVNLTGVAIGTVVAIGSGPVFTGLLLLGRVRPTARWAAATAAAVAGCAVLILGGGTSGADARGIALALLGGLLYAAYVVIAARAIEGGAPSDAVMGAMFGGAAALMLPVLIATGPSWLLTPGGLTTALYLGLATTALSYILYGRGLRTTPVATASTLALAEPAVAAVLGVAILGEHLSPLSWTGLALLGTALIAAALPDRPLVLPARV